MPLFRLTRSLVVACVTRVACAEFQKHGYPKTVLVVVAPEVVVGGTHDLCTVGLASRFNRGDPTKRFLLAELYKLLSVAAAR